MILKQPSRAVWRLTGLLLCAAWVPAAAQSPIGSDIRINEPIEGFHDQSKVTAMGDGTWRVVWVEGVEPDHVGIPYPEFVVSRSISREGLLGPVQQLAQGMIPDTGIGEVFLTGSESSSFTIFFGQGGEPAVLRGITFDQEGRRVGAFARSDIGGLWDIVPRKGELWTALGQYTGPFYWEVLDTQGKQVLGPRSLDRGTEPGICAPGFAATLEGGGAAVWSVEVNPPRGSADVRARFFTASGERGPEFRVNPRPGNAMCPQVAMLPDGREAWVLYMDSQRRDPPRGRIYVQRVSFSGERVGSEIQVGLAADETVARMAPKIVSDPFGNFVVAWTQLSFDEICGITGRLFRSDGRPVGPEFAFSAIRFQCGLYEHLAFAENGTFAAVWLTGDSLETDTRFARFSASPADEPCLVRGGRLLCDTGRTGGLPEIDQAVMSDASATVLMGDVDGDGRADPCALAGTRLRCDLDHRGEPFEWERTVDASSGTVLLGDVDGDGRADPCVWRAGLLRCQTASGEFQERFGAAGDVPLLGDLAGDRREELCVWRRGTFSCDTAHDGGSPERTIAFGLPADVPLLGDFDGDGRADPCVFRGHRLLCDTAHDGGLAEGRLMLATQPGDRLLLANLDGL
jgi:hypothetical protein